MSWTVPAGVTVTGWNGTFTQEGTRVTVTIPLKVDTSLLPEEERI